MKEHFVQHNPELPTARSIRRTCQTELYRTIKRMKVYIAPDKLKQAEQHYFKKVASNIVWIHENRSNRKKQVEWWEENVLDELVVILEVDREKFAKAFRTSYGV